MTYIKKKRAREIYLAKRELFRCATYNRKVILAVPQPELFDGRILPAPMSVWP